MKRPHSFTAKTSHMRITIRDVRRDASDHPQTLRVPVTVHRLAFACVDCADAKDDPAAAFYWMRGAHAGEDGRLRCEVHHREKYGEAAFLMCPACEQGKPAEEWQPEGVGLTLQALDEQEREALQGLGVPHAYPRNYVVAHRPCRKCRDRTCSECGADITHMRADALTCSASCRQKRRRRRPH